MCGVLRSYLENLLRDLASVHHSSWSTEELADIARIVAPSCVIVDTTYLKSELIQGFIQFALQNNWTPIVGLSLLDGTAQIYAPEGVHGRVVPQLTEDVLIALVRQGATSDSFPAPGGNHGSG